MTEITPLSPAAPRLAMARETVAAALVLSAAAHAGLILWAVSGEPTREMVLNAGAPTAIEVKLVQGPDQPAAGSRQQQAVKSATAMPDRMVTHDAKQPPDSARHAEIRATEAAINKPSDAMNTPFAPEPQPAPVAAHQAPASDTADPQAATAQPLELAPPHPPAKPAPPSVSPDGAPAASGSIAALDARDQTPVSPAIAADPMAANRSALASDAAGGPDGRQGASPRADNPAPEYPYVARQRGEFGRVVLRVEVLASGEAGRVSIERSSGYDVLDQAASETVKRWRFVPARRNGAPIAASVSVPIRFALQ
jgi:periplasmic protein TonB